MGRRALDALVSTVNLVIDGQTRRDLTVNRL